MAQGAVFKLLKKLEFTGNVSVLSKRELGIFISASEMDEKPEKKTGDVFVECDWALS